MHIAPIDKHEAAHHTTNNKQQNNTNKQQTTKQHTTNNKQQTTKNKQQATNRQHTTNNKQQKKQWCTHGFYQKSIKPIHITAITQQINQTHATTMQTSETTSNPCIYHQLFEKIHKTHVKHNNL